MEHRPRHRGIVRGADIRPAHVIGFVLAIIPSIWLVYYQHELLEERRPVLVHHQGKHGQGQET